MTDDIFRILCFYILRLPTHFCHFNNVFYIFASSLETKEKKKRIGRKKEKTNHIVNKTNNLILVNLLVARFCER